MSTSQQIEATRRNALASTGPTTAEGKAASRLNSEQSREDDPHAAMEANEAEETFNRLVQEAAPKVRAKLNAIPLEQIRAMAPKKIHQLFEMVAHDPDAGNRVFGRKAL